MAEIFISHRTADTAEAERLASELRGAGHTVWIDVWRIDIGDSIVEKMNEGLTGARYLILCCSSASIFSPWMSREWMSALARQMSAGEIKLLPVYLTGRELPALMADAKAADLVDDWSQGLADLLRAIK